MRSWALLERVVGAPKPRGASLLGRGRGSVLGCSLERLGRLELLADEEMTGRKPKE